MIYILYCFLFLLPKFVEESYELHLSSFKYEFSEIEEIQFNLSLVNSFDLTVVKLKELPRKEFELELIKGKIKKEFICSSYDFHLSKSEKYNKNSETYNLEKLIGTLEDGNYSMRIITSDGKNKNLLNKTNKIYSNWLPFKISKIEPCLANELDVNLTFRSKNKIETTLDSNYIIPFRENQALVISFDLKNKSQDSLAIITNKTEPCGYSIINDNCDWENKYYFTPTCISPYRIIESTIIPPDSTIRVSSLAPHKQGIYKAKSKLHFIKNNGEIDFKNFVEVYTCPVLVNGFRVERIFKKDGYPDF